MPIYTYRCENCGVQFDRRQKFSEEPLKTCPECGKKTLRKVYLPVGIVFKGSGFYATDHHSKSGITSSSKSDDSDSGNKSDSAEKESTAGEKSKSSD
jgi:putative FmdB family regulatory protein